MTRPDLKSGASPRVSVRQRRQQSTTPVVIESTSGGVSAGRPSEPLTPRETSRAELAEMWGRMGQLFQEVIDRDADDAAQEQNDSSERAPDPDPALARALERALLAAKKERLCMDCGKYPATTRSGLCSRCYVFNKC